MSTIRAFIAIGLPEAVRRELEATSNELNRQVPHKSVRWVRPENIHLTLKFLGDTELQGLKEITGGMDRLGRENLPFELYLDQIGCFPNPRRPRIVWVGVQGDLDKLQFLQKSVDQMVNLLGWELDKRKFHPHLTLGRVKDYRQVASSRLTWGSPVKPVKIPVDSLTLYESVLKPSGAVYSIRHTCKLDGQ